MPQEIDIFNAAVDGYPMLHAEDKTVANGQALVFTKVIR